MPSPRTTASTDTPPAALLVADAPPGHGLPAPAPGTTPSAPAGAPPRGALAPGRPIEAQADATPADGTGGVGSALAGLVVLIVGWLLAGPRIELVAAFGSSVRLEDCLLGVLLVVVAAHWTRSPALRARRTGVLLLGAAGVLSAAWGTLGGGVSAAPSLLYALRPLEYWVVYPAVLLALERRPRASERRFVRMLAVVTVVQVVAAVLQAALGLSVGFSKFAYDRGAGLTAGPYELGAICAALACYWLWRQTYSLAGLALVGVVISASRISLLAVAAAAVFVLLARRRAGVDTQVRRSPARHRLAVGLAALLAAAGLALSLVWGPALVSGSLDRLESTSINAEWSAARQLASSGSRLHTSDAYQERAYTDFMVDIGQYVSSAADASTLIRFYRWHLLLGSWSDPADRVLGLGPSFAGPSVDGAYVRVLVEGGLVGVAAWSLLTRRLWSRNTRWFQAVLVTTLVGGIFIDIPFAMRPAILVWVLAALAAPAPRPARTAEDVTS